MVKGANTVLANANSIPESAKYLNYTYDRLNRCTNISGTLSTVGRQYTYDTAGNVLSETKGGNTVNYTYDPFGNVLTVKGGTDTSKHISYTYNALGLRASMTDETGTTNYTYNDFGELTAESKGDIIKTSSYDSLGNRTSFAVTNDGTSILNNTYTYDNLGRILSVAGNGEASNYTYDKNGNITQKTIGNIVNNYVYNSANLCVSQNCNSASSSSDITYSYYVNGNMRTYRPSYDSMQTGYFYDGMSRIVSVGENYSTDYTDNYLNFNHYEYDEFGNRISKVKKTNGLTTSQETYNYENGLLTTVDKYEIQSEIPYLYESVEYAYDSLGNLTMKEIYDNNDELNKWTSYTYDYLNRLSSVNVFGTTTQYAYDGDNLRQSKTINNVSTQYILDGANVVAESKNSRTKLYIRGNGIEFEKMTNGSANYYIYDALGNVQAQVFSSDEYLNGPNYIFDEYGIFMNGYIGSAFGYRGEYHDEETGLIYLRNRYYDPETGRFITEDPVMDGLNWYVYCGNNPIRFIDSFGLIPTELESAYMAKHIYDATKEDYNKNLGEEFGGWKLKDIFVGEEGLRMGVYYRTINGNTEYALVNKGTDSWSDWINNFQQPFGASTDMEDSIQKAKEFVNKYSGYEITMIGHSKGGAEAVANAVATNTNCIVFNPATVFLSSYDLKVDNYDAEMTVYVVKGELLNALEGVFSKPVDQMVYLEQKYPTWLFVTPTINLYNSYRNHSMDAVIWGLNKRLSDE